MREKKLMNQLKITTLIDEISRIDDYIENFIYLTYSEKDKLNA